MNAILKPGHPDIAGFDQYYASTIAPALQQMEGRRKTAARTVIALGVLVVLGFLSFLGGTRLAQWTGIAPNTFGIGGFIVMFAAGAGAIFVYSRAHGSFKDVFVGKTCAFLGLDYQRKGFAFDHARFREAGIVAHRKKAKLEDRVAGTHDGVPFALCEARLTDRKTRGTKASKSTEDVDVFHGMLLIYSFPKRFKGRTVIVPDYAWLGNKLAGLSHEGERVMLEDPRFESRFEVYSDDQVEARYLLTPRFMERITELASHFGNPYRFAMAFDGSDLLIAFRGGKNHFEGGHLFKPLADRKRVDELFEELSLVLGVIEILDLSNVSAA